MSTSLLSPCLIKRNFGIFMMMLIPCLEPASQSRITNMKYELVFELPSHKARATQPKL